MTPGPPVPIETLLAAGLEARLREMNPWWAGASGWSVPPRKRWLFPTLLRRLEAGIAPATALRGPRQVGKSTLLEQVISHLLESGVPGQRILRVQFDDLPEVGAVMSPILEIVRWYAQVILKKTPAQARHDGEQVFIFLDEVQNLPDWSPQIKFLVDMNPVRVLLTGSSSLRIDAGRDSLAGRIQTLELGPLLLSEIAAFGGLGEVEPLLRSNSPGPLADIATWQDLRALGGKHATVRRAAFRAFARRGGYPFAHVGPARSAEEQTEFLVETVVRRVIRHDLANGGGDPARAAVVFEAVFSAACRLAGQIVSPRLWTREVEARLQEGVRWTEIQAHLDRLQGSLLVRLIEPYVLGERRRAAAMKPCLSDHALRAAWLGEQVPLDPEDIETAPEAADAAGRIAESIVGAFFASTWGLDVYHQPERPGEPEVDFILYVGDRRVPVEVKYRRRIDAGDLRGLRRYISRKHHRAAFGVVVTLDDAPASDEPAIVSVPLSTLLLLR